MTITIYNVRQSVPTGHTPIYVGRPTSYRASHGEDFSQLGNPFSMPKYSREAAIEYYEQHLWACMAVISPQAAAISLLVQRARAGEALALGCWCAPQRCHAEVVKEVILECLKETK